MIPFCYWITRSAQRKTNRKAAHIFSFFSVWMLLIGLVLFSANTAFGQEQLLEKTITIERQHTTLYNALNIISDKADCFFVYDSKAVESDKRVKLEADNLPLKQVLEKLLDNPRLAFKVIDQHILIYPVTAEMQISDQTPVAAPDTVSNIIIKGHVFDNQDKKPVPYASIGIQEENLGTITNADGFFIVKLPAKFAGSSLSVSHLGYENQKIPIRLLNEQRVDLFLERRVISIQEVIIRYVDPAALVAKAMQQRLVNNSLNPVYMTTFYREGVQKNGRVLSYSEAVLKVFKSSFEFNEQSDQVKLLKSRNILNINQSDTARLKLKAGILASLQLDIVKCIPTFMDESEFADYTYSYADIVSYNSQNVYAITFVQKKQVEEPLYTGTLFIDKESFAILGAEFEINPKYLNQAASYLIVKKSRKLIVKLEKIKYSISYMSYNGRYYLNHARCDITLKTRTRNHLSFDNFSTFLETATCHIDTANVTRFGKQEVIKPNVVFSDASYVYDEAFWGDYNIIAPEEKLNEALSRITSRIEKIE
ncbi:MAG TPA: carboxypeptidase-like regulatory domain-containing protein [Bacteroidales bacterium]